MNASLSKKLTYQRSENPSGGKVRNSPALTEASTTMTSGGQQVDVDEDHDPEIADAAGPSAQAAPSGRGRAVRLARRFVRHAIPRMAREVSRK